MFLSPNIGQDDSRWFQIGSKLGHVGPSWGDFWAMLVYVGASCGHLKIAWTCLSIRTGSAREYENQRSNRVLFMSSCLWACVYMGFRTDLRSLRALRLQRLGASWGHLGGILGHLGASWEQLASILGACEESMLAYVGVCWPILRHLEHVFE